MKKFFAKCLVAIAVLYWLFETYHFGWHGWPKSDAEFICDGISLVLLIITSNRLDDLEESK